MSLILAASLVEAYHRLYDGVLDGELTIDQRRTFYMSMITAVLAVIGLMSSIMPYRWCTKIESILIISIVTTYAVGSVYSTVYPAPPAVDERFIVAARE